MRQIELLDGDRDFGQEFRTDVRVPGTDRIGAGTASGRISDHSAAIGRLFRGLAESPRATSEYEIATAGGAIWTAGCAGTAEAGRRMARPGRQRRRVRAHPAAFLRATAAQELWLVPDY
ncbi:hypothetical protein ABZV91_09740 [Nocardia sp. NPDC004568]|uniref:hypothetical protein n=1 Tax=Nocardia sp. NPDC004568 TaxID=3154551 RepID=UPI0033A4EAA6